MKLIWKDNDLTVSISYVKFIGTRMSNYTVLLVPWGYSVLSRHIYSARQETIITHSIYGYLSGQ